MRWIVPFVTCHLVTARLLRSTAARRELTAGEGDDAEPTGLSSGLVGRDGKPKLVITAGPTGAGKSGLQRASKAALGAEAEEFVPIIVDDLVENEETYKKAVAAILAELEEAGDLEEQLTHPTPQLSAKFFEAYSKARTSGTCGNPELAQTTDKDGATVYGGCDQVNDQMLKNAIAAGKNILFETTVYFPGWLFRDEFVGDKYDAYYAGSLVDMCSLLDRNKNRAYRQAVAFLKDPENSPAPRLPDVTPTGPYPGKVRDFKQTIHKVVRDVTNHRCTSPTPMDDMYGWCVNEALKGVLIYDNNDVMTGVATVVRDDAATGGKQQYSSEQIASFGQTIDRAATEPESIDSCAAA